MSKASKETHLLQQEFGNIQTAKQIIENYLKFKAGMSSADLSDTLGMVYSTFCARLSELVDEGKVYYKGTEEFFDRKNSKIYFEHNEEKQKERAKEVKRAKFQKTLRRLKNDFEDLMTVDMVIIIDTELA